VGYAARGCASSRSSASCWRACSSVLTRSGACSEREIIDAAAEVGVILLLFTIGIEFSIGRLLAIRRLRAARRSLQVADRLVAVAPDLLLLAGVDLRPALFTGLLVSLSSTAIVLKLLGDRGSTSSPTGRTSLGLLIFQDLAVVAMVLLLPVLGEGEGSSGLGGLATALGTAAAVIVVTLVVARRVMPPVLEAVARACSPEVFLLSVIALCVGTAYLTALAGVSVSLGAFLAGLVVSESRHSAHALGEVLPLQILFSATFFLSIGTLLDVRFLLEEPLLVLGAVALVLVVKTVTTFGAAVATGVGAATATSASLLLAQVGEFAFVLERQGAEAGLTPAGLGEDGSQAFITATVLLLVATPALAAPGPGRRAAGRAAAGRAPAAAAPAAARQRRPRASSRVLGRRAGRWQPTSPAGVPSRRHDAVPGRRGRGRGAGHPRRCAGLDQEPWLPRGGRRGEGERHRAGRRRARAGGAHRRRPGDGGAGARSSCSRRGRGRRAPSCTTPGWRASFCATAPRGAADSTVLARLNPARRRRGARSSTSTGRRLPADRAGCVHAGRRARPAVGAGCTSACARAGRGSTCACARAAGHVGCCDSSPGAARRGPLRRRRPPGHVLGRARRGLGLVLPDQQTLPAARG
jgi:CPA2 family monovalent cation:H+ antiporter-2